MAKRCTQYLLTIMMQTAKVTPMIRKSPSRVATLSTTNQTLGLPLLSLNAFRCMSTLNTTLHVRYIMMELSHSSQPRTLGKEYMCTMYIKGLKCKPSAWSVVFCACIYGAVYLYTHATPV